MLDLHCQGQLQGDFAQKLVTWFGPLLEEARDTGCLNPELYEMLNDFFSTIRCDTQDIEGVNSIIKYVCHLARNIGFKLLRARILAKKYINALDDSPQARREFVERCVQGHGVVVSAENYSYSLQLDGIDAAAAAEAREAPPPVLRPPHSQEDSLKLMCCYCVVLIKRVSNQ